MPSRYISPDEKLARAEERIEKLENAIKEALKLSGNRWAEWGTRAEAVAECLDRALEREVSDGNA